MCRKRRGLNAKIKFRDIFFSFSSQKEIKLVINSYFCCIRYLFGESWSLITFEKIETFICQSQRSFRLQTRQLLIKWTLQETFSCQNDIIQYKINNLVSIAFFLLCNKMLSGHKKVNMVLEMKFQDKTKFKRYI